MSGRPVVYVGVEIGFEPPLGWGKVLRGVAAEDDAVDTRTWIPSERRQRRTWVVDARVGASPGHLALSPDAQQEQREALAAKFTHALEEMARVEAVDALLTHRASVQRLERLQAELDRQQTALQKLMEGAPSAPDLIAVGANLAKIGVALKTVFDAATGG